ncbi:nucleotidyltransferase domain-containing protein [Pontiellaceae bacterium B12227]|nr:nucleotidyltransferase domain-containing protein [Pontiellaceae bacterium B12227]
MITQQQAISSLKKFKAEAGSEYGIISLGIFGSLARNQATELSDIDVVVETEVVNPFQMVHLKEQLELILDMPVDIVRMRKTMNAFLKKRIENEAVYV